MKKSMMDAPITVCDKEIIPYEKCNYPKDTKCRICSSNLFLERAPRFPPDLHCNLIGRRAVPVHESGKDALEPDIEQQNPGKNRFRDGSPEQDDINCRTKQGDNEESHSIMFSYILMYTRHTYLQTEYMPAEGIGSVSKKMLLDSLLQND